jgi:hypothetical protein
MAQRAPARPEGTPTVREITVQTDLASRTLDKLQAILDQHEMGQELHPDTRAAALAILREAFREAHCDATVNQVYFWDLGGQSRARGLSSDGEEISLPATALPPVGTVLDWNGKTYYVASHRA